MRRVTLGAICASPTATTRIAARMSFSATSWAGQGDRRLDAVLGLRWRPVERRSQAGGAVPAWPGVAQEILAVTVAV
jgi:hypothetical protein